MALTAQFSIIIIIIHIIDTIYVSANFDDREAIQMHAKQPVKEHLLHYQLYKPS